MWQWAPYLHSLLVAGLDPIVLDLLFFGASSSMVPVIVRHTVLPQHLTSGSTILSPLPPSHPLSPKNPSPRLAASTALAWLLPTCKAPLLLRRSKPVRWRGRRAWRGRRPPRPPATTPSAAHTTARTPRPPTSSCPGTPPRRRTFRSPRRHGTPADLHSVKVFSDNGLTKVTQDFSGANKIGEGGFGSAFSGANKIGHFFHTW